MRIFRRFNEVGVTVLIASHDIALIDRLGCRRIELDGGRLAEAGGAENVLEFDRADGPEAMRPVGETEFVDRLAGPVETAGACSDSRSRA